MSRDKQDATHKLKPDEPTQETSKGLKIGVPSSRRFLDDLKKASKPDKG
jgi:hypothetical protein